MIEVPELINVADLILEALKKRPEMKRNEIESAINNKLDAQVMKSFRSVLNELQNDELISLDTLKDGSTLATLSAKGHKVKNYRDFVYQSSSQDDRAEMLLKEIEFSSLYALHNDIPEAELEAFRLLRRYDLLEERARNQYDLSAEGQKAIDMGGFKAWKARNSTFEAFSSHASTMENRSEEVLREMALVREQLNEMTEQLIKNGQITKATGQILFKEIEQVSNQLNKPENLRRWFMGKLVETAAGMSLEGVVTRLLGSGF